MDAGSSASYAEITSIINAASFTDVVIGPAWSRFHESGNTPRRLTRPYVGLNPTTPHNEAGMRIEPPVSVPSAPSAMPVATAIADPLDDPPGMRVESQGLRAVPKCGLSPVTPRAISCVFVLPMMDAPACLSFSMTNASVSGMLSAKNFDPIVVRSPAVSYKSFTAMGIPRREFASVYGIVLSFICSCAASSLLTVMNALSEELSRLIWARQAEARSEASVFRARRS